MATLNPLLERAFGVIRRTGRSAGRLGRRASSTAAGKVQSARHRTSEPKPGMDDITIAHKVETELFREAGAPKGQVNVSAVDGVVELRGQVKHPDEINDLEARARAVPEVRDVRNLLHLPKTPSPTRADSPPSHRKRGETERAGRFSRAQTSEREARRVESR